MNWVGNDSGTTLKFLAFNSAECVVKSLSTDFFAMFNSPKGDMMGIGSVSAIMFLLI